MPFSPSYSCVFVVKVREPVNVDYTVVRCKRKKTNIAHCIHTHMQHTANVCTWNVWTKVILSVYNVYVFMEVLGSTECLCSRWSHSIDEFKCIKPATTKTITFICFNKTIKWLFSAKSIKRKPRIEKKKEPERKRESDRNKVDLDSEKYTLIFISIRSYYRSIQANHTYIYRSWYVFEWFLQFCYEIWIESFSPLRSAEYVWFLFSRFNNN